MKDGSLKEYIYFQFSFSLPFKMDAEDPNYNAGRKRVSVTWSAFVEERPTCVAKEVK